MLGEQLTLQPKALVEISDRNCRHVAQRHRAAEQDEERHQGERVVLVLHGDEAEEESLHLWIHHLARRDREHRQDHEAVARHPGPDGRQAYQRRQGVQGKGEQQEEQVHGHRGRDHPQDQPARAEGALHAGHRVQHPVRQEQREEAAQEPCGRGPQARQEYSRHPALLHASQRQVQDHLQVGRITDEREEMEYQGQHRDGARDCRSWAPDASKHLHEG
mmetsp:Transcript_88447/g.239754  ORF Transcript_88447/g.239754 Transcript_88447/m.239754 type:complete len:218 (+) Transcript_88447:325-978(+)